MSPTPETTAGITGITVECVGITGKVKINPQYFHQFLERHDVSSGFFLELSFHFLFYFSPATTEQEIRNWGQKISISTKEMTALVQPDTI